MKRFIARNRREPISPIWESFVDSYWRPKVQHWLMNRTDGDFDSSDIETLKGDLQYHAFNFSHVRVNRFRGYGFIRTLDNLRGNARLAWWPQNAADMLEVIKREREEMDTLGYIRSAAVSRRGQEQASRATVESKDAKVQTVETPTTRKSRGSKSTSSPSV